VNLDYLLTAWRVRRDRRAFQRAARIVARAELPRRLPADHVPSWAHRVPPPKATNRIKLTDADVDARFKQIAADHAAAQKEDR
jgi:hypothetical protein